MTFAKPQYLKLQAKDLEDFKTISALTQDSLVALRDISWESRESRFTCLLSRFCWERHNDLRDYPQKNMRVRSALMFMHVDCVDKQGFSYKEAQRILNLLATTMQQEKENNVILLHFSKGAKLRLQGSSIRCFLEDLGEPWPVEHAPRHFGRNEQN